MTRDIQFPFAALRYGTKNYFFLPKPGSPLGNFGPSPGRPGKFGGKVDAPGIFGGGAGAPGSPGGKPSGIFLASSAICSGLGMLPPKPSILASPAIGPRLAPPDEIGRAHV